MHVEYRRMMILGGLMFLSALASAEEPFPDEWKWDEKKSHITHCAQAYKGMFEVIATPVHVDHLYGSYNLRVLEAGKVLYEARLPYFTAFQVRGNTLYRTDYRLSSSGCALVAVDLPSGKQLWRSELIGLGPVNHSRYENRVTFNLYGLNAVVYGNEMFGNYVEVVELKTGKTLHNTRFK